ncbi:hypothetical protein AI2857V1_3426 [Serratia marcescens]|nr:hypothetical protein AI2857V1_3426 [Serratia marcescens]CAH5397810.1 hypothetical protein AI2857V1_3426 [Serratia marcescens]
MLYLNRMRYEHVSMYFKRTKQLLSYVVNTVVSYGYT